MGKIYATAIILSIVLFSYGLEAKGRKCVPKDFDHGSIVCVCNATYCDDLKTDVLMKRNQFVVYTSSKDGERFQSDTGIFKPYPKVGKTVEFQINSSITYQEIFGFGAAFTDTATMHLHKMKPYNLYDAAMDSYFSPTNGIRFTFGRIPMASTDFSSRVYSYDDVSGDFDLKHFALAKEDLDCKIPALQDALNRSENQMRLLASPWTAPAWLKINNKLIWGGIIMGKAGNRYHKTWAQYFVRFLQAYKEHGLDVWGITPGNAPVEGLVPGYPSPSLGYTAKMEKDFIKKDLGPALKESGFENVKIIILDDQRSLLPDWAEVILNDDETRQYVNGIAVQWYTDSSPHSIFNVAATHILYPDVFLIGSEARSGYRQDQGLGVILGSWERGEAYSIDILDDLNNWLVGWLEWCLVVDMEGGPSWMNSKTDAPIIVDYDKKVFYKQPMFYHMGHISRFVPPGSVRINIELNDLTPLKYGAFLTPNKEVSVIIVNPTEEKKTFMICDGSRGCIHGSIKARAIQTYTWKS